MKKTLIICLATLFSFALASQSLIVPDAEWYYNYDGYGVSGGYVHVMYSQDTLINDTLANLCLSTTTSSFMDGPIQTNDSQDFIYYTNEDQVYRYIYGHFELLYDLSASVGDTLETYAVSDCGIDCDATGFSIVDSVGTRMIGGQQLRYLYLQDGEGSLTHFSGYIYERLGSLQSFPYVNDEEGCICDGQLIGMLRCYSDFEMEYTNPNYTNECDFVVGISEYDQVQITIAPNPSDGIYDIRFSDTLIQSIAVYNVLGARVLFIDEINNAQQTMDLSSYKSGTYLLKITTRKGDVLTKKLYKR